MATHQTKLVSIIPSEHVRRTLYVGMLHILAIVHVVFKTGVIEDCLEQREVFGLEDAYVFSQPLS